MRTTTDPCPMDTAENVGAFISAAIVAWIDGLDPTPPAGQGAQSAADAAGLIAEHIAEWEAADPADPFGSQTVALPGVDRLVRIWASDPGRLDDDGNPLPGYVVSDLMLNSLPDPSRSAE